MARMFPRTLLIACVVLSVLRLVLAAAHEITPAEAHLWVAAQHPQWGYFDHGPLAAWLVKLSSLVFGQNALAVRVWAAPLMLAVSWVTWRLVFSLFGEKVAGWTVAALNVTPWFNLAGIVFRPSTLGFALAVPALWLTWRALHRAGRWDWHWPAAGGLMGLAMLAAPEMAALVVGFVMVITVPRRWRGRGRRPGPWLALLAAVLVVLPWVLWVRSHGWMPLWSHWVDFARAWHWEAGGWWLLGLIALASPVVFAGLAWAVGCDAWLALATLRRRLRGQRWHDDPFGQKDGRVFLLAFALPAAGLAVLWAFRGAANAGAAALPAFCGLLLLLARWLETPVSPAAHRLAQNVTLLVASLWALAAANTDFFRHCGLGWPFRFDPTSDWRGWRTATESVDRALRDFSAEVSEPVFVIAGSPDLAATLEFGLPRENVALFRASDADARCQAPLRAVIDDDHALWPRADRPAAGSYEGKQAVYVTDDAAAPAPGWLTAQFASVSRVGAVEISRGDWPVRRLTFFACRGYRRPAW